MGLLRFSFRRHLDRLIKSSAPRRLIITALAGGLEFLAGCATVPDTGFLYHRAPSQLAEFKNAWGPIPAQTSAAVVAELKRKAGNLDILDRQIAIEQAVV